jgi:hypothetical protein
LKPTIDAGKRANFFPDNFNLDRTQRLIIFTVKNNARNNAQFARQLLRKSLPTEKREQKQNSNENARTIHNKQKNVGLVETQRQLWIVRFSQATLDKNVWDLF